MTKRSLIVYYSWVGSTAVVTNIVSEQTGIPLVRIEETKVRPLGKIMGPAFAALIGAKSRLKPMDFAMNGVQTLIFASPVWAGKTPPAINSFLKKADFQNKEVWLLMTMGDDKPPMSVIQSITSRIEERGGVVKGHGSFQTHWDPKTNVPITEAEIQDAVTAWLTNVGYLIQE